MIVAIPTMDKWDNNPIYEKIVKYICENPICWYYDELYSEE